MVLVRPLLIASLAALMALAAPALAKNGGKGEGHCPPGLAKKLPPCVPPGQAAKGARIWSPGEGFDDDDAPHWVTNPGLYELPPLAAGQRYVILGNRIYVVDAGTEQVISLIRAVSAVLD